jgi:tetratricopeptide (TPR) repeat protein
MSVARYWLKAAIELGDDVPEVYLSLGIVAEKQQKPDEAMGYFERYLKAFPRDYNIW